jgi:hypothetical protein
MLPFPAKEYSITSSLAYGIQPNSPRIIIGNQGRTKPTKIELHKSVALALFLVSLG